MVNNDCHRSPQENEVQPQVPVVDVPAVHLHTLGVRDIASAACLPHAGDTGKDSVIFCNIFPVPGNFRLHDWSRSYEAHFAFQHIPELGEFVEAGFPEESAALCDAGVVFQFEFLIPFRLRRRVRGQEMFQHFLGVHAHGPELVAVEFFPVLPHSPVLEDHGARGVVVHPDSDDEEDRRNEDAAHDGGTDIEEPLQEAVPGVVQVIFDVEHHDLRVEEGFHGHVGHGDGYQVRNDIHLLHQGLGAVNQAGQVILGKAGRCNQYGVDAGFLYHFFHISKASKHGEAMEHGIHRMAVFQEPHHPVPHAGIVKDLPHHQLRRLPGAYDEHGNLEGPDFLEDLADENADHRKEGKGQGCEEQHKEPGHLSRHLGDEHEEHGEHGPPEAGEEDALRHLVHQHPFSVEPFEEEEQHKHQGQPEEEVRRRQVEGAVGHDPVPEVHGKEPRHHQGEVVKERKNNSR